MTRKWKFRLKCPRTKSQRPFSQVSRPFCSLNASRSLSPRRHAVTPTPQNSYGVCREAVVTTRMAMYQHEIAASEDWSVAPPDELRAGPSPDTGPAAGQQTIYEKPTDAFWRSTTFLPIEQSHSVSSCDARMENQWDWDTNPNGDAEASDPQEPSGEFTPAW